MSAEESIKKAIDAIVDGLAPTPPTEEPRGLLDELDIREKLDEARRGYVWVNHVEYARDVPLLVAAYERVVAERDEARHEVFVLTNGDSLAEVELERLHTWDGLMSLVDEHYPTDIFPVLPDAEDRDAGPRILSLLRHLARLRSDLNQATAARQRLDLLAATFDGNAAYNGSGLYAGLRDILASWRSSPSEGNTTP